MSFISVHFATTRPASPFSCRDSLRSPEPYATLECTPVLRSLVSCLTGGRRTTCVRFTGHADGEPILVLFPRRPIMSILCCSLRPTFCSHPSSLPVVRPLQPPRFISSSDQSRPQASTSRASTPAFLKLLGILLPTHYPRDHKPRASSRFSSRAGLLSCYTIFYCVFTGAIQLLPTFACTVSPCQVGARLFNCSHARAPCARERCNLLGRTLYRPTRVSAVTERVRFSTPGDA